MSRHTDGLGMGFQSHDSNGNMHINSKLTRVVPFWIYFMLLEWEIGFKTIYFFTRDKKDIIIVILAKLVARL